MSEEDLRKLSVLLARYETLKTAAVGEASRGLGSEFCLARVYGPHHTVTPVVDLDKITAVKLIEIQLEHVKVDLAEKFGIVVA